MFSCCLALISSISLEAARRLVAMWLGVVGWVCVLILPLLCSGRMIGLGVLGVLLG